MEKKIDISKIVMNPIRMRIIQFLMLNKTGTTIEMRGNMTDIPTASLYRHIKVLLDANLIEVVEEKKNRGTMEKTYALPVNPVGDYDKDKIKQIINTSLLSLMGDFNSYFEQEDVDPMKDMLSLSASTLLLSDQEYEEFLTKMGELFISVIGNKPEIDRKVRRITFISSPSERE